MGLLESQQPARKKRRKKTPQDTAGPAKKLWYWLLGVPLSLGRLALAVFKDHPRVGTFALVAALSGAAVWLGAARLHAYAERRLPDAIKLDITHAELNARVRTTVEKTLAEARARKLTRPEFTRRLATALDDIDMVDEYWIRTGIDGRLRVRANTQVPILVLEAANGERYLIGHRLKIMAKNFSESAYPGVLRIWAPELRMQNARAKQTLVSKGQGPSARVIYRGNTPLAMNFSWLANQGQRIRGAVIENKVGFTLEKISWKSANGFVLTLKRIQPVVKAPEPDVDPASAGKDKDKDKDATEVVVKPQIMSVVLGETDLPRKVEKLAHILQDLNARQLVPENVDLNFQDKALIKLSESGASGSL